jgi:hypothetical protein
MRTTYAISMTAPRWVPNRRGDLAYSIEAPVT